MNDVIENYRGSPPVNVHVNRIRYMQIAVCPKWVGEKLEDWLK